MNQLRDAILRFQLTGVLVRRAETRSERRNKTRAKRGGRFCYLLIVA